ncbi:hypothetical protein KXD93_23610 [Mucilaginibacter sp. BJC16-A38]|uniref:hypothetical protein n=1 Tax=Mucilaginibacter phenanthrenivorans TaxID=1234842 RepID=UPI0021585836|nr:hypothetical protein [Mucilaginibacter phenanthrenivorans]MCR8560663.1 hypothetical protein [Mucilaginibacter phenanthrenivorans]
MKYLVIIVLVITSIPTHAQASTLPQWFLTSFKRHHLNDRYEIKSNLKPTFLQGDFNGDGVNDIAALVTEKKTHKGGILLIHGCTDQWFVFGAGTDFGSGSDDFFNWLKKWKLCREKVVYETTIDKDDNITGSRTVKLKRPGINLLMKEEAEPSPVAVIYWNGKKYIWIHQGE